MKKTIDLYVTVTSFDSDHLIKGKITFRRGATVSYSAKKNRTEIMVPILLGKKSSKINNSNMPSSMMRNIKIGIKEALSIFLEKRSNPNIIDIPDIPNKNSFTGRMYANANKIQGSKMMQFEIETEEYLVFFRKKERVKVLCHRPIPPLMQQAASN